MANPNSRLTAVRLWLTGIIRPRPDGGEGWCIGCSLNGGRTQIISADAPEAHAMLHHQVHPGERIHIQTMTPALETEQDLLD